MEFSFVIEIGQFLQVFQPGNADLRLLEELGK